MEARRRIQALREAYKAGALDDLLAYLRNEIGRNDAPLEPEGPEWPYKRAYQDGKLNQAVATFRWLDGRLKESPDGAENTGVS